MKRWIAVAVVLTSLVSFVSADEDRAAAASIGYSLNEYADNFGLGLELTTPFFFDSLAFRADGTVQFSADANWKPWFTTRLGAVGAAPLVADFARFYGEGGVIFAFPGDALSSSFFGIGGYGHFGFEFFTGTESPISYFLEAGGIGSGLRADKLASSPMLLNGFYLRVGFRGYPYKVTR